MIKHSSSFNSSANEAIVLESTIIAKKLAVRQPSSLSLDDISMFQEKLKSNDNIFEAKTFTKPNPINAQYNVNRGEASSNNNITNTNKFAILFGFANNSNKKNTKNNVISKPMQYELPNVKLIHSSLKSRKPIKIVELSPTKNAN